MDNSLVKSSSISSKRQPIEIKEEEFPEKEHGLVADHLRENLAQKPLTVVVFGASGHLARTKTYPSLAELYDESVFPQSLNIIGFARSKMDRTEFHDSIVDQVKLDDTHDFLEYCTYFQGDYSEDESFKKFAEYLAKVEKKKIDQLSLKCDVSESNRLFYFATPPNVFIDLSRNINKYLSNNKKGWTRVIVEKPFGEDLDSCNTLLSSMAEFLREHQIYRIDHYLAKEMVQNMLVLRFSNTLWDTIWDRRSIKCVKISMKESEGVSGRGGYYDDYGVIRDVFQNHLIQVLCLTTMEAPVTLSDDDIRNEKVKVLKAIETPSLDKVIVGQYGRSEDGKLESYLEDSSIQQKNPKSRQLTFAQIILSINNKRWAGVPFICKCGKGLDARNAEIRIQFKNDGLCLYPNAVFNELAIRLQPSEAIWLRLNTKKPGFARLDSTYSNDLDLTYQNRFDNLVLPGAYTRLILDCLEGDQSLFVRDDELREAWRIVTPLIKRFEDPQFQPPIYPRGSRGPPEADEMAFDHGFLRSPESMKYGEETQRAPHEIRPLARRVSEVVLQPKTD